MQQAVVENRNLLGVVWKMVFGSVFFLSLNFSCLDCLFPIKSLSSHQTHSSQHASALTPDSHILGCSSVTKPGDHRGPNNLVEVEFSLGYMEISSYQICEKKSQQWLYRLSQSNNKGQHSWMSSRDNSTQSHLYITFLYSFQQTILTAGHSNVKT